MNFVKRSRKNSPILSKDRGNRELCQSVTEKNVNFRRACKNNHDFHKKTVEKNCEFRLLLAGKNHDLHQMITVGKSRFCQNITQMVNFINQSLKKSNFINQLCKKITKFIKQLWLKLQILSKDHRRSHEFY